MKSTDAPSSTLQSLTDRFRAGLNTYTVATADLARIAGEYRDSTDYKSYIAWLEREFDVSASTGDRLLNINDFLVTSKLGVNDLKTVATSALQLLAAPQRRTKSARNSSRKPRPVNPSRTAPLNPQFRPRGVSNKAIGSA